MKKTLLVLATLAATAGVASAANVTVYGTADLGLSYEYAKAKVNGVSAKEDVYGLESGNLGASKFGLKGTEELGNGLSVGFKLENGFAADTGKLKTDGRIFDREASLNVSGAFGTVYAGRMGALSSGAGTLDIFQANADVFDGGVGNIGAGYWHGTGRYDNTVAYVTPDMAGLKLYAQYGFQNNGTEEASARDNDRYWGIGATYQNGPLGLVAVVDSIQPAHIDGGLNQDSFVLSFGGNYDLGSAHPFFGVQYGKHMNAFGGVDTNVEFDEKTVGLGDIKGYALSLGSTFDLPCGTLTGVLYYAHSKGDLSLDDEDAKVTAELDKGNLYGVGLVHAYPLSKRTTVYTGVGYTYGKFDGSVGVNGATGDIAVKTKAAQVLFGLNHNF